MKEKKLLKIQSLPKMLRKSKKEKFITGQNEREETTQDAIFTKSAAFASYEINYLTYITATYTRAKRRWHGATKKTSKKLAVAVSGFSFSNI
jgi:hypothetical protein